MKRSSSESAARAQAPDSLGRIGKILTVPLLIAHGTEHQKSTYLPAIMRGEPVWCRGFSEPGSGSDLASLACFARKVDDGYLVRGRKTWTSFSRQAERCLLLARTDDAAPRYKNLSLLLLDMRAPGVDISPSGRSPAASTSRKPRSTTCSWRTRTASGRMGTAGGWP